MAQKYIFADECGNFDFSRKHGASRYFILVTTTAVDCDAGHDLLRLRRSLALAGRGLDAEFHAAENEQAIRDDVFAAIQPHAFRIDATILEKSKSMAHLRATDERFYKYAWFYHMKHLAPRICAPGDQLLIVGASLGQKKKKTIFHEAISEVMGQVSTTAAHKVACWPAASDPCLQVADYCAWAIQRKWERGDVRSYSLIQEKIRSEFDLFQYGTQHHY
jgi:hypothetical protein